MEKEKLLIDQIENYNLTNNENSNINTISSLNNNDQNNWARSFSSLIIDQLNTQDVRAILESQQQTLLKLDATNKNLIATNHISNETLNTFGIRDYQSYINLLNIMKQDLELIFKRIRVLKTKLETKYPNQYSKAVESVRAGIIKTNDDDEEDEENENIKPLKQNDNSKLNRKVSSVDEDRSSHQEFTSPQVYIEGKERSASINSNSSSSASTVLGFLQTARERLSSSSKELVNGILNSSSSPNHVQQNLKNSNLLTNTQESQINTGDLNNSSSN